MASIIYDVFVEKKSPNRDREVLTLINYWCQKNAKSMSNGIIQDIPMFANDIRKKLEDCYKIEPDDIKRLNECIDYKRLQYRVNKNLKIGLIISWIDTRDDMYLVFLSLLVFSEIHRKYFPTFTGATPKILESVINASDNRTDFKKHNKVLLSVVYKRIDNGIRQWMENKFKKGFNDHDVIEAITSIDARYNGMMRILAVKTYEKIKAGASVQYNQTTDANEKHVLSSSSDLATIREAMQDDLTWMSAKIMKFVNIQGKEAYAFEKFYDSTKMKALAVAVVDYIDERAGNKEKSEWMEILTKLSLTKSSKDVSDKIIEIVDGITSKSAVPLNKKVVLEVVIKYVTLAIMYRISRLGKEDD